jgi:hypothetical protein
LLVVGSIAALVCDISFVAYFSAPYSESAGFVAILLTAAAVAWHVSRPQATAGSVCLLLLAGIFLVCTKAQLTPLGLVLVAPVMLAREVPFGTATGRILGRVVPACATLLLVAAGGLYLRVQPAELRRVNMYNLTFSTLLVDSPDPAHDLAEMGLPVDLARYKGSFAFSAELNAASDPDYPIFEKRMSRTVALKFLARHPSRLQRMLQVTTEATAQFRLDYLSNFDSLDARGHVRHAERWDPATQVLPHMRNISWPWLPIFWVASAGWGLWLALRRRASGQARAYGSLVAVLAIGAAVELVVALLGDGYYEVVKHTHFAAFCTVALTGTLLGGALSFLARRWGYHPR